MVALVTSCNFQENDPQEIVDKCILAHGGEKYAHSTIEFDFRGRHYVAKTNGGKFSYERIFKDSAFTVHDFLTNEGFVREIDGHKKELPDSMVRKYTASVNSVIYFAQLPYRLNDPSVNKKLLGTTTLDGEPYYKIEITFGAEGGGEGYRDTFYYWIHQKNFTMDYFAYFYDEDGVWEYRFRKVLKQNRVNGIMFQDYINFRAKSSDKAFTEVEAQYISGELVELSRIVLENITVQ